MTIALFNLAFKPENAPHIALLLSTLEQYGIRAVVNDTLLASASDHIPALQSCASFGTPEELYNYAPDGFISLGGDGTFLNALTLVRNSQIPIIGINLGRLGFLATIATNHIPAAIDAFARNRYHIESHSLLQIDAEPPLFGDCPWAINDFTLLKRDTSSMITVDAFLNGAFLNTYWADGLIVSTPTGSTGYNLSCGGPVVFPLSGNFVITPVAPHNLGVRPIVIPDDAVLSFQVKGRTETFLATADSRYATITLEHEIAIRKAPFPFKRVVLHGYSFLATLREKLAWGRDLRN